ncbi:MAG: hypothetical protein H7X97_05585 [Opitutaceae bacterium]|nr:hypothetical protein [Verrucomicrobiales bacterium]
MNQKKSILISACGALLMTLLSSAWSFAADEPSAHNPCFDQPGLWPADVKKTDYYKQKLEPARLLVWAHKTDHVGSWKEAANWLEDGKPATKDADENCDVYFPDGKYKVIGGVVPPGINGGSAWESWGSLKCRNLTIGNGTELCFRNYQATGNVWVRPKANFRIIEGFWNGGANTFARNDMGKWVEFKIPQVNKTDNASVEVLGLWGNADGLYVNSGKLIIGPDSAWYGGDRHQNTVGLRGSLILMSGAKWATFTNKARAMDLDVYGELLAGTPERPLEKDAIFSLSYKSRGRELWQGKPFGDDSDFGLMLRPMARMAVHSADPTKARLVFNLWQSWRQDKKDPDLSGKLVQIALLGKTDLNGVLFDNFDVGGVELADPAVRGQWKNVFFGKNNAGNADTLFKNFSGKASREQPFYK